jgi:hypothetical protein
MVEFMVCAPFLFRIACPLYSVPVWLRMVDSRRESDNSIVQAANDQHRRRFGDCSSYTLGSTGTDSGFAWESSHDLRPLSFAPAFYIKYIYSVYIQSMYNLSRGHFDVKVT